MDEVKKVEKVSSEALEWCESIVFAIGIAMVILVFGFKLSVVSGSSMSPTLSDGDQIIVQSFLYSPKAGDVITTDAWIDYVRPLAKRVIAVGGDVVDINGNTGEVIINGAVLKENYIAAPTVLEDVVFPVTVPAGKVFVMGDNRQHSLDSRSTEVGFIDERDLLGKVVYRIKPANRIGAIS